MSAAPGPHRRTERLLLCRPAATDLDAMYAIHADPATNRYNPTGPVADRGAAAGMLDGWIAHWERHGFGYWTVRAVTDAEVLGFGGLQHTDVDGERVLNLYYRFGPRAWGKGHAAEMAQAALVLADELGTGEPVVALVRDTNLPSQRVATRAGLTATGTIDHGGVPTLVFRRVDPTGRMPQQRPAGADSARR